MKCNSCGGAAKIYLPHMGVGLCDKCFIDNITQRVKNEITKFGMISPNDTILMGISGGKDSYVLLDVLSKLHDPSRLIALTIVEGIEGYNRAEEIEFVKKSARERGVEHLVVSIESIVGYSLSSLVRLSVERKLNISACTYCGILRRRIINEYARQVGASKTATAHNLDDEVQTLFINIFRGDASRILRQHPLNPVPSPKLVKRIKPLRKIYEWEAASYAYYTGYRFQEEECPYIINQPTIRARIRRWMVMLEKEKPGILLDVLVKVDELVSRHFQGLGKIDVRLNECKMCGEPTSPSREFCKICELLLKLEG